MPDKTEDAWGVRIDRMRRGDVGYVSPQAVTVDLAGNHWLSGGYALAPKRSALASMKVEFREDGFHIKPPNGYRWPMRGDVPGPSGAFKVQGYEPKQIKGAWPLRPRRRPQGPSGPSGGWGDGPGPAPRPVSPPPENEGRPLREPVMPKATITEVTRPAVTTTAEDDKLLPRPQPKKKTPATAKVVAAR